MSSKQGYHVVCVRICACVLCIFWLTCAKYLILQQNIKAPVPVLVDHQPSRQTNTSLRNASQQQHRSRSLHPGLVIPLSRTIPDTSSRERTHQTSQDCSTQTALDTLLYGYMQKNKCNCYYERYHKHAAWSRCRCGAGTIAPSSIPHADEPRQSNGRHKWRWHRGICAWVSKLRHKRTLVCSR